MSDFCPNCRQATKPNAKFCSKCGHAMGAASATQLGNPPSGSPVPPAATPATPAGASRPPRGASNLLRIIGIGLVIYVLGALGVVWLEQVLAAEAPALPVAAPADPALTPRVAGQKGLDWLLDEAVAWQGTQRCYGCHVQSFAIMGAAVAQHSEYAVNLEQTRQLADFLASTQTAQGYISAGRGGEAGITTQTALAGIGLGRYDEFVGPEYATTLVQLADWLVAQQANDGHWTLDHAEAPVDQGDAMMTGAAINALVAAQRHAEDDAYTGAIQRGTEWLRSAPLTTTQDRVFAIIGLLASGAKAKDPHITQQVTTLQAERNVDGGWGETADLESNGYATGQVLYAFQLAGVKLSDESFTQGVVWLLDHQSDNGSWPQVNSQQRNGNRSSQYATTMWAVIGLGEIFDKATEAAFISIIHPDAGGNSAAGPLGLGTFLVVPLLLVLPLWWNRQGQRWYAGRKNRNEVQP